VSVDSWTPSLKPLCHRHPTGPHPSGLLWTPVDSRQRRSDQERLRARSTSRRRPGSAEAKMERGPPGSWTHKAPMPMPSAFNPPNAWDGCGRGQAGRPRVSRPGDGLALASVRQPGEGRNRIGADLAQQGRQIVVEALAGHQPVAEGQDHHERLHEAAAARASPRNGPTCLPCQVASAT
jgi:hypothetical protein